MKNFILLLLLLPAATYAQDKFSAPLPEQLFVKNAVSPSGKMVSLRYNGVVYTSPGMNALWNQASRLTSEEFDNNNYNTIDFLSDDVIIIAGLIFGTNASHDFILRSADAGKTWNRVTFGRQSQIDETWFDAKGRGWMSGSSEIIYYTENFGEKWVELKLPKKDCRVSGLHFLADGKTGIVGSLEGRLFRTVDNCDNWTEIPTPRSQKKYTDNYDYDRAELSRVRIIGKNDSYIIRQEGRTFFSKAKTIDWERLRGVQNFEVTEQGNVYLIYQDGTVELRDSAMHLQWTAPQKIAFTPHQVAVRDNSLYVFDTENVLCITPKNTVQSPMLTNDRPIPDPDRIVTFNGSRVGITGSDVYLYDAAQQKWYRHSKAPFPAANALVKGDKLLLLNHKTNSYYSYNIADNTYTDEKIKPHFNIADHPAKTLIFETGSRGCYHFSKDSLVYNIDKGNFIAQYRDSLRKDLRALPRTISAQDVEGLIALINDSQEHGPSVSDYNFTASDIADFVNFIAEKKKESRQRRLPSNDPFHIPAKADLDSYIAAAKNILATTDATIETMLSQFPQRWSTSVTWVKATVVFDDDSAVTLFDDTLGPKYMRAPYLLLSDGLVTRCMSVRVAEKLNQLTNSLFCEPPYNSKGYALFNIADYISRHAARDVN